MTGREVVTTFSVMRNQADKVKSRGRMSKPVREGGIQVRFMRFHVANPHVYEALLGVAMRLKQRGFKTYSMKAIYEIARWERIKETQDPQSVWKLNNDYTSRYARLIMQNVPGLVGFFETRELRAL